MLKESFNDPVGYEISSINKDLDITLNSKNIDRNEL